MKKTNTGVSNSHNSTRRSHDRHHGAQRYCVIFKKAGFPEHKYMLHSTEDCNGVRTNRSIKDEIGGPVRIRTHAVQQHKKSENKWKKELKSLKKQNNMLYSIAKKLGSRREIQEINKIRKESSKETYSSSEDWYSASSLARNGG